MPIRQKLAIAFSLVLLLTVIVSMTSWWGLHHGLESQKEVHDFQNSIEQTFFAMARQEQAFTSEETITHSRLVLNHISALRQQLSQMQEAEHDTRQQDRLATVLALLEDYQRSFSAYVQQNLEMQTLRSRMEQEAIRLHARTDALVLKFPPALEINHLAVSALLAQKEYIPTHQIGNREVLTEHIGRIQHLVESFQREGHPDEMRLLAYRIDRAAAAFVASFERLAGQRQAVETAHRGLRKIFFELGEAFSRTITAKTELVKLHIASLQTLTITMAILAVLLGIAATLLLSELLTRPIDRLKLSARKIVDGDLNTSVQISSRDEIGELGELFNTMTHRLRTSFRELATYRDSLEEQVMKRTRALEMEINERRETEKELAASERRFRTFFDNANDGLLVAETVTGKFVLANHTICQMLGHEESSLLTLAISDIHPASELEWILREFRLCAEGKSNLSVDIPVLRKDGSIFPAEINAALIDIGDQQYLLGSFRDISERKVMEEERLKVRKLESVGMLAGGIAHDFNNILAAILGNTSLALTLTDQEDKRFPLLKAMEKACLRASDLTRQLLTFSKGGEPVRELISVAEIIKESASFILRGSNVRCDFDCAEDLWDAEVDGGQISQVIQNITVNAKHAMTDGGIVTITCRNVVPASQMPKSVAGRKCLEINIADNGPGIPSHLLQRIFDPYFTTKEGGSGLGLAITHSIISKHQGIISVQSAIGKGTAFTILLPAANSAAARGESGRAPVSQPASGTIMVMDDEAAVRDITCQMLRHMGYIPVAVADGQEAIDTYRRHMSESDPPDLVVMDLTIPGGMGGREAAARILEIDPAARLVVSSGYSQDPIMANFSDHGFRGFLGKPFQFSDLQLVLQQVLQEASKK